MTTAAERGLKRLRQACVVAGAALVGTGVSGVLGGCNIVGVAAPFLDAAEKAGTTTFPAQYEGLEGETFAVVVNADPALRINYPRVVNRLTNAITREMATNVAAVGFVPGPKVLEFQFSNPRWSAWQPLDVADEFTVTRLVMVDLLEYRLNEPGNAHLWEGRAVALVNVYEAEYEGNDPAFTREVKVSFPDGTGYTRTEISQGAVAANLETRLVNRISWLMYEHTLPNTIEY